MTDTNPTPSRKGQFTGWHMLAMMLTFFGIIFSVNLYMAMAASRTWTGLVVENSYVASQQFNKKLTNARAQQALGWKGGLSYSKGTLLFTLVDGEAAPLNPSKVTIDISRPIGTIGEQTLVLTPMADGTYTAPLNLADGVWNAAILANFTSGPDYEHRARLRVTVADAQP